VVAPFREVFMERQPLEPDADVTALPHGTKVGAWRLKGIRGRGAYGTVYRAVREGDEQARVVALKLAIHPRDARFKREAELLRRGRHPSVPQLLDSGEWRHPNGFSYPFIVMSWVEGEGLYGWAARRNPSSREVKRLLTQAARALQVTHEAGGVHRDVKGDNVRVRPADGRLFLMDFGAGHYKGAERLTSSPLPPGTPMYRSPEAWAFDLHQGWRPLALYVAGPADDVFALGVMAYRLVTDEYPPFRDGIGSRSPREVNPRVDTQLDAVIQRMLSPKPEERGSAKELAEMLEREADHAGPETDAPLFEWETLKPTEWSQEELDVVEELGHRARRRDREVVRVAAEADAARRAEAERQQANTLAQTAPSVTRDVPRERNRPGLLWLVAVMLLGALVLWLRQQEPRSTNKELAAVQDAAAEEKADGGVIYVGDTALTSAHATMKIPADRGIALEVPPKPQPGQVKPDAKGRCNKGYVAINGGCWLKADVALEECKAIGFEYRGGCYAPIFPPTREPTSAPMKGAGPE
jgi:tRNA A-37 threonylcarbamoyl transferase component Bud32